MCLGLTPFCLSLLCRRDHSPVPPEPVCLFLSATLQIYDFVSLLPTTSWGRTGQAVCMVYIGWARGCVFSFLTIDTKQCGFNKEPSATFSCLCLPAYSSCERPTRPVCGSSCKGRCLLPCWRSHVQGLSMRLMSLVATSLGLFSPKFLSLAPWPLQ